MKSNTTLPQRTRPDRVKPPPRPPSPTPLTWSASNPKAKSKSPSKSKRPTTTGSSDTDSDSSEDSAPEQFHDARFPPDHEAELLSESHALKSTANAQFASADYSQAVSTYDRALASCPNYLDFEVAVLQSNVAACHLKLEEWREAIESADRALDALDREDPPKKSKKEKKRDEKTKGSKAKDTGMPAVNSDTDSDDEVPKDTAVVELPSSDSEADTTAALNALNVSDERLASINRIRTKSLLRRARARSSLAATLDPKDSTFASSLSTDPGTSTSERKSSPPGSRWTLLQASLSDYQTLSSPSNPYLALLPPSDLRTVRAAMRSLPPQVDAAKQAETAEMMGKLKELGNGILKPFGLSTDMFKMVQDEKTGGYSLSFEQGKK